MKNNFQLPDTIQAIVFDFDGVFTDNTVLIHEDGRESVFCNRSDGLGISLLKKTGLHLLVLSTEENTVVEKRCEKLGIPCIHGINNKKKSLETWLKKHEVDPDNVVYIGNDINDIDCIKFVGCGVAVSDAHEDIKKLSKIILTKRGGHGAVRELCELVLSRL